MIARVFLFIFIAINSQVLGDDFLKNWTSKIDFAKLNALGSVKSDDPVPPGYLRVVARKINEKEELERQKLHHLPRVKKIIICDNSFDKLINIISKLLLSKPSVIINTSGANSSIVSTTSASRPSSTSSIITSTESSTTSTSRPNEVITLTTVSSEDLSQMQMVNDTEIISPSSAETMTKDDSSIAKSPPDMKDFDTKISNDSDHSMIDASNLMLPKNESMPSKSQIESSMNGTMINNPDKVKQPNPVATIDNTTDVSTSPSTESSPTIAELTPKPVENDPMTTFMSNPAVLVPDDLQNVTSHTPVTSESPIDILENLNMSNINSTASMMTKDSLMNVTVINETNKIKPPNSTAPLTVNGTNTSSPIILPQVNQQGGFDDTSNTLSSTQFPIDVSMMNNSHKLTPLDFTNTEPSTVLSTNNRTENTTSVSASTTTKPVTNSENSTTSKPLASLPNHDLMSNKKQNSATSNPITADFPIATSTMSSSHLAAHDSELQGTESSNIPIATDSTMSSSDTSTKDPPSTTGTSGTDASNKTTFDDFTPLPLATNTSLNSSTPYSPINQTSVLTPLIPDIPSFNRSLEAPLVPESDSNLMTQIRSSNASGPPISDSQIKSTLPPQPINSSNIASTTQVSMIPIVMTMTSPINNNPSVDSSMRNESMPSNESSTMNPSGSTPIIQTSDSNPMIPNVPSSYPSSPGSDSDKKPMTLLPPLSNSVNTTSTTQVPMIPIVTTMSPQVSSHPIDNSSMKNESNASNLITTTTPSNSIPIDHNSNPIIPNEPSENPPSNSKNTSSTHSDPSQPLAVTPEPHGSGDNLAPAIDPFGISYIYVDNIRFEDPLGPNSPDSSEASSSEYVD
ncbi:hypothetical protein KQX54_002822 [Cotesia glomerata]|uniref:Uncharacterized protein n=1 Tax=Cotesia glomerata TaxID=32391 RepID=A0AAV7HUE4_COTGL|nr:hypothetical protein KQX54_002822 [Cotesia glomerata]